MCGVNPTKRGEQPFSPRQKNLGTNILSHPRGGKPSPGGNKNTPNLGEKKNSPKARVSPTQISPNKGAKTPNFQRLNSEKPCPPKTCKRPNRPPLVKIRPFFFGALSVPKNPILGETPPKLQN